MKSIIEHMEDYISNLNHRITHSNGLIEDYRKQMIKHEEEITQYQITREEYIKAVNILKRSQNGIY